MSQSDKTLLITKNQQNWSSIFGVVGRYGSVDRDPTRNLEVAGSILGLPQWVKDLVLP